MVQEIGFRKILLITLYQTLGEIDKFNCPKKAISPFSTQIPYINPQNLISSLLFLLYNSSSEC